MSDKIPQKYLDLLIRRDGAAQLLLTLPKDIAPSDAATFTEQQRMWELCGLHYLNQDPGRFHEALAIFQGLYDHMLVHQEQTGTYSHKGMPLVWMSECHAGLAHPVLAKRYLMLTTCEDAIKCKGIIPSETGGVYFRMVWRYGSSKQELDRYASGIWDLYQRHPEEALFPEWILQELDQEWIIEYSSPYEATRYEVNTRYVRWLLTRLGSGDGKALERLAHYLLSSMPDCRAHMRRRSKSTDYDVICSLEGLGLDFRSELGRYFLCECKDWATPANFTSVSKFCNVLESAKCRFGILFSKHGLTGADKGTDAERELLKVFQKSGLVVVVISQSDLERVAAGANFITMLRSKYETVRLDLRDGSSRGAS